MHGYASRCPGRPPKRGRSISYWLHSITYRIAVGPQAGRKVFTLQSLPACDESFNDQVGKVAGLLRASCPPPFGPACGCSKSLPAILSRCMLVCWPRPANARSSRGSSQTTSSPEHARWHSTATITLAVHPWHGETVGVLRWYGEHAVYLEREDGIRRIVPVARTSLVPRVASRLADGRPVRINPEGALELTRWIALRLGRDGRAGT